MSLEDNSEELELIFEIKPDDVQQYFESLDLSKIDLKKKPCVFIEATMENKLILHSLTIEEYAELIYKDVESILYYSYHMIFNIAQTKKIIKKVRQFQENKISSDSLAKWIMVIDLKEQKNKQSYYDSYMYEYKRIKPDFQKGGQEYYDRKYGKGD